MVIFEHFALNCWKLFLFECTCCFSMINCFSRNMSGVVSNWLWFVRRRRIVVLHIVLHLRRVHLRWMHLVVIFLKTCKQSWPHVHWFYRLRWVIDPCLVYQSKIKRFPWNVRKNRLMILKVRNWLIIRHHSLSSQIVQTAISRQSFSRLLINVAKLKIIGTLVCGNIFPRIFTP